MNQSDVVDRVLGGQRRGLEEAAARIPGLELEDGHRGVLRLGPRSAEVRVESAGWIRVEGPVEPLEAGEALRRQGAWPGNVRFVRRRDGGLGLAADLRLDGLAHLPATLGEIRRGLADAWGMAWEKEAADGTAEPAGPAGDAAARLAEAVRHLPWGEGGVVPLEPERTGAWELRPRVGDAVVPVRLTAASGGARLWRPLLRRLPEGRKGAVAEEALRINAARRFCRLTWAGEELVVEAWLHEGLWTAAWIGDAAEAIATTARQARRPLELLAAHPGLARLYLQQVCGS